MLDYSLQVLRCRWKVVLLAMATAAAATMSTLFMVPPTHKSEAAVLLVPSERQPGVVGPTNPLLELGGSVGVVASVIQIAVSDDQTARALTSAGMTADYEVLPDLGENAGPVLLITAEDPDAAVANRTRDALVDNVSQQLDRLQNARKVRADLRVSTVLLTSSSETQAQHKRRIQLSVAAGGTTLAVLLSLVLLLDRRRNQARGDHRGEELRTTPPPPLVERSPLQRQENVISASGNQRERSDPAAW